MNHNPQVSWPVALEEVLARKTHGGDDSAIVAGGQSLSLLVHHGLAEFSSYISLQNCDELRGIRSTPDTLEIGAMVTSAETCASPVTREFGSVLSQAASKVATPHVRNIGTVVGSLCHNEPGSDAPVALLALDATVRCQSEEKTRRVKVSDFLTGYLQNGLQANEIATAVEIPKNRDLWRWFYVKNRVRTVDLAIVNVAGGVKFGNESVLESSFGVGGIGSTPSRLTGLENELLGKSIEQIHRAADELAAQTAHDTVVTITDDTATSAYRRTILHATLSSVLREAAEEQMTRLDSNAAAGRSPD